jgi:hypothetical protein
LKLLDSDNDADGTANLAFESSGAYDITATLQTDVAGTLTTMVTLDGVNNKITLTPNVELTADITPDTSDGSALGTDALDFSDIFLADGAVINLDSGDVTITHASDTLAFAGATSSYTFDDAVDITGSGGLILQNDETITNAVNGTILFTGNAAISDAAPDLTMTDSTAGDGTGNLSFQATGAQDIVATLQADIAGTPTTFISLDGTNEEVLLGKKLDIASLGIENVGAIADDGAISVISSGGTVTIESVVFTGGAMTSVASIVSAGDVQGGSITTAGTDPTVEFDETDGTDWELRVDDTGNSFEIASSLGAVGDNVEVEIDEDGDVTLTGDLVVGGGDLDFGNFAVGIGTGVEDSYTFSADSTGDAEFVVPNDSIGPAELDSTTGAYDFGGVTSLEIPNGTSNPASTTGAIALDTDGTDADFTGPVLAISTNGATMGYIPTMTDMPSAAEDNYIMKYDAGSDLFVWEADASAGTTAWDDIADPDNDGTTTIDFDHAAEATVLTTIYDTAGSFFTINNSDADLANNTYLLDLNYSVDDDQANADYIKAQDAGGVVFTLQQDGDIATTGTVDITDVTEASAIGTAAVTIDGGASIAKDLWIGDDLTLDSDGAILSFGDDQGYWTSDAT